MGIIKHSRTKAEQERKAAAEQAIKQAKAAKAKKKEGDE